MKTKMKKKVPITVTHAPATSRLWCLLLPFYLFLYFN